MSEQLATADPGVASVSGTDLDLLTALDGYQFPHISASTAPVLGVRNVALVLVGDDGLWFRARFGFPEAETPRAGAFWDVAMATEGPFVIEDLLADPRFASGPRNVGGVEARFFASYALRAQDGRPIGVYCLADPDPQEFDPVKRQTMGAVVTVVEAELAGIRELDRAAEVQRALLPKRVPPLEGYEVAGACVPAKAVGGDFFDWYSIPGGIAVTLGDVMGKGVGAGIIAATVRATVRSATHEKNIAVAVDRVAATLAEDLTEAGSFVTLFHARLRATDGRISFVDAGHGLTVVVEADGTARRLSASDVPLGMPSSGGRQRQRIVLAEGATLVSVSDGVLDLYDGTLASVDRVADIAREASSADEIVDEIERLARRDAAPDDVTVVAIRRLRS